MSASEQFRFFADELNRSKLQRSSCVCVLDVVGLVVVGEIAGFTFVRDVPYCEKVLWTQKFIKGVLVYFLTHLTSINSNKVPYSTSSLHIEYHQIITKIASHNCSQNSRNSSNNNEIIKSLMLSVHRLPQNRHLLSVVMRHFPRATSLTQRVSNPVSISERLENAKNKEKTQASLIDEYLTQQTYRE